MSRRSQTLFLALVAVVCGTRVWQTRGSARGHREWLAGIPHVHLQRLGGPVVFIEHLNSRGVENAAIVNGA